MADLSGVSDTDLVLEWMKRRREAGEKLLGRSMEAEVRHVCLYASQQLSELRTIVLKPNIRASHIVVGVRDIIGDLEALVKYLETGRGGTSALGDRNDR